MPVIKRYPNRKLYDTEAKRYVTLGEIASSIREGQEVVVIDHATEEDLTAVTLSQIIFEQEKQQGGFLPKAVLTNLVRAGGDTLTSLRRGLSLPLDMWRQVDEEIDRRVQYLISKGELAREEGQRLRDKLMEPMPFSTDFLSRGEDGLDELLDSPDVPSQEELVKLHAQLQTLSTKLDQMIQQAQSQESGSASDMME